MSALVILSIFLYSFVLNKSRIATTLLVVFIVATEILSWYLADDYFYHHLIRIIYFFFMFNAMIGTYIWHTKYREVTLSTN